MLNISCDTLAKQFNDLKLLNNLTGEADATNLGRSLCDLSEDGARLVEDYFGIPIQRGNNWNSQFNGVKSVASIMLTYSTMKELLYFHYVSQGAEVWECWTDIAYTEESLTKHSPPNVVYVIYDDDRVEFDIWRDSHTLDSQCFKIWSSGPHIGTRNTHQMSGRNV